MKIFRYALAACVFLLGAGTVSAHEGHDHSRQSYVVTPGRPDLPERVPIYEQPWTGDPEKFSFAIIGDKTGGGELNWPIFDRAVDEINRLNPDFAIMVGDLIQGYTDDTLQVKAQWEEFQSHAGRLTVPFLFLPGNHDVAFQAGQDWWERYIGLTYYSFTYKNCLFIAMNTSELFEDNERYFSDTQVEYVLNALRAHPDVRHTFVFMHHPAWAGEDEGWSRIEDALQGRQFTVVGGHWHRLQHEKRNDQRFFVHGATGGGLTESDAKILGRFHHYTLVVIDDDAVDYSAIEPGANWPIDTAPMGLAQRARELTRFGVTPVVERRGRVTVGVSGEMKNELGLPARVALISVLDTDSPWSASADTVVVDLAPGEEGSAEIIFRSDARKRLPAPSFRIQAWINETLMEDGRPQLLIPYTDEQSQVIDRWMVMGPFDVGPFDLTALPNQPEWAFPKAFESRPPDAGYAPRMSYEEDGVVFTWQEMPADSTGRIDFNDIGRRDYVMGYASAAVYSPKAQTVAVRIRADNYMEFWVNGDHAGQLYGTPYDYTLVPVTLKRGWNELLIKLINNRGDWYLWVDLYDPEGNLRTAPHKP